MVAISFLASDSMQQALEAMFTRASVTSLDAERAHTEAKQWERSRLSHVGTAARNCFLQRYARERQQAIADIRSMRRSVGG